MNQFMQGAIVMGSLVIGMLFLRFFRRTGDRLFIFFAISFWLMGMNWLALAFSKFDEPNTGLYAVRLAAFILIILGIWDKNRSSRRRT